MNLALCCLAVQSGICKSDNCPKIWISLHLMNFLKNSHKNFTKVENITECLWDKKLANVEISKCQLLSKTLDGHCQTNLKYIVCLDYILNIHKIRMYLG